MRHHEAGLRKSISAARSWYFQHAGQRTGETFSALARRLNLPVDAVRYAIRSAGTRSVTIDWWDRRARERRYKDVNAAVPAFPNLYVMIACCGSDETLMETRDLWSGGVPIEAATAAAIVQQARKEIDEMLVWRHGRNREFDCGCRTIGLLPLPCGKHRNDDALRMQKAHVQEQREAWQERMFQLVFDRDSDVLDSRKERYDPRYAWTMMARAAS